MKGKRKGKKEEEFLSLSLCPRCDSLSGWLRRNKTWKIKHLVNRFSSCRGEMER